MASPLCSTYWEGDGLAETTRKPSGKLSRFDKTTMSQQRAQMTDANFPMRCAIYSCMCAQYLRSDRLCRSLLLLLRVLSDCACSEKKETLRRSLFPRARDNVCWSRRKSGVVATIDSNFPGQNSSVILFLRLFFMFLWYNRKRYIENYS